MSDHRGHCPEITRRERDVLVALCSPAASSELFVEPASVREIAAALAVTEAAVKQHLLNLYGKFEIAEGVERRRVALAREAVRRGAIAVPRLGLPYPAGVAGSAAK
jgi:DNA-binding NarL/FixJ family response regulator